MFISWGLSDRQPTPQTSFPSFQLFVVVSKRLRVKGSPVFVSVVNIILSSHVRVNTKHTDINDNTFLRSLSSSPVTTRPQISDKLGDINSEPEQNCVIIKSPHGHCSLVDPGVVGHWAGQEALHECLAAHAGHIGPDTDHGGGKSEAHQGHQDHQG